MNITTPVGRRSAAVAVAAALCLPLAACQAISPTPSISGRVEPALAPTSGITAVPADPRTMPDHPERLGIRRWCYPNHGAMDVVERNAAARHCAVLRGELPAGR